LKRNADAWVKSGGSPTEPTVQAGGAWVIGNISGLAQDLAQIRVSGRLTFELEGLVALDTAGALMLLQAAKRHEDSGGAVAWSGLAENFVPLFERVMQAGVEPTPPPTPRRLRDWVEDVGAAASAIAADAISLIAFFGEFVMVMGRLAFRPLRWRPKALVAHIEQTGLNAIPIISLISFLVGVVLAYQGADQLRRFGAQIFTVNLVGVSVLREMGILLTAIVVAGRSGSAFTAQIGTMQVNEEVDALRTLGLDPIEVLVLPRVLALAISLPLLAFLADLAGLLGGGLMTVVLVDINFDQYLSLLKSAVNTTHFWVGISKAPVFAMLIALVGCFEGLRVSGSAESVGRQTTRSVVEAIFLVIIFDALFSVLFSLLGV
jgi:phospholipid/cholesterol/gamma-HCH transport system permease protein